MDNDSLEMEIEVLEDKVIHLEKTIDELKHKIHRYEAAEGMKRHEYDSMRYMGIKQYAPHGIQYQHGAAMGQSQELQSGVAIAQASQNAQNAQAANNHHAHQLAMYNMEQRMHQPQHQGVLYPPPISPEPQINITEPSPESTIMRAVNYFRSR